VIARAILPDDREKVRAANEKAPITDARPAPLAYRVVWPDGTLRHVLAQPSERILDEHGRRRCACPGSSRTSPSRHHAGEALRDSEFRYRNLFDQMAEGFALCEMRFQDGEAVDFKYLQVNEAFGKLTGLADVTGKWASEVIPKASATPIPAFSKPTAAWPSTGKPDQH
jgi:PAS domain-containing protein